MTTGLNQNSARIYQFPTGGRAALGSRRLEESERAAAETASSAISEAASGSGWYHDAAIQDEIKKPAREH